MIQQIQNVIWQLGGFLFTVLLVLLILTYMFSKIINRLSGWTDKEGRNALIYWIRNKERLKEIIEKEKKKK